MRPDEEILIHKAADVIQSGGVVILPTETFYALSAHAGNQHAIERIFRIKRRDQANPLPLIASDTATVLKYVNHPDEGAEALMRAFWPGSLTILLTPSRQFSSLLSGPRGKIAVRVPPKCAAGLVAGLVGDFITATSANISGDAAPDSLASIDSRVINEADMVLDFGRTPGGKPSTLVEIEGGKVRIVRDGAIPASDILKGLDAT
jgi:L-threonylcarbamoyladenylate synthase